MSEKKQSLTVFKSDRHEDIAAIILAAVVVASVLITMAFLSPSVTVYADSSGVVSSIAVSKDSEVKKGDVIYTLVTTEKVWKGDVAEEVRKEKKIKAKANGKILDIYTKPDAKVSKHKTPILELAHEKGSLP